MSKEAPSLIDPTGRQHVLSSTAVIIGRAVENDIVISSTRVSREHARVMRQGWRALLEDLGSTNGTFLNGERIHGPMQLRDGDQIKVGDVVFTFRDPEVTTQETALPELEVDVIAGVVRVNRQLVTLAPKEFDLLAYLFARRGEVCAKDDIGTAVWPEYQSGVYDYQIENLVRRLRTRLEADPAAPQLLLTIRGRGYKLMV
ncbi:MAG TPA: FHA domain-containing protein [Chloroflexota bacterium]|nr:FHA domain-containing protein [Chloroflexota bacterium]HUM71638.1 FHA domain-containing protein [Chloroflexota bacterium]